MAVPRHRRPCSRDRSRLLLDVQGELRRRLLASVPRWQAVAKLGNTLADAAKLRAWTDHVCQPRHPLVACRRELDRSAVCADRKQWAASDTCPTGRVATPATGDYRATPVTDGATGGQQLLPFVEFDGLGTTPEQSVRIARRAASVFLAYLEQSTNRSNVPKSNRIAVQVISAASTDSAKVYQGAQTDCPDPGVPRGDDRHPRPCVRARERLPFGCVKARKTDSSVESRRLGGGNA